MAAIEAMGNVLVVAGPGAGKTQVLVHRISNLIKKHSVHPKKILALTFTRKAAREMQNRIKELTNANVNATTFHSFCVQEMRKFPSLFNIDQNADIIDDEDRIDIISTIINTETELVIKGAGLRPDVFLLKCFSKAKNKLISVRDAVREYLSNDEGNIMVSENLLLEIQEVTEKMYDEYDNKKRKYNKIDYDDILYYYYLGLKENKEYVNYIGEGLFLLVDEYQDTNAVQLDIIKMIGLVNNQVFAVGDDMQAIYLFRDADIQIMKRFQEEICGNREPIFLRYNYRSKKNIVDYINKYMGNIQTGIYHKVLIPSSSDYGVLEEREFSSNFEQARAVVNTIIEKIHEGVSPKEIAVLYRADFLSYHVEAELNRQGIQYKKIGGRKFLERAHIKDLLSCLLVIVDSTDIPSLFRILTNVAKINRDTSKRIINHIEKGEFDIFDSNQILRKYNRVADKLIRVKKLIEECQKNINSLPAKAFVELVSNYMKNLYKLHKSNEELLYIYRDYDIFRNMSEQYNNITNFLSSLLNQKENYLYGSDEDDDRDIVTLSTIHGVKGEEYDVVIVINTGYIPKKSMASMKFLSEEERIHYVAITRAKKELHMFCVTEDKQSRSRYSDSLELYSS